jgi:hypothetical protein
MIYMFLGLSCVRHPRSAVWYVQPSESAVWILCLIYKTSWPVFVQTFYLSSLMSETNRLSRVGPLTAATCRLLSDIFLLLQYK